MSGPPDGRRGKRVESAPGPGSKAVDTTRAQTYGGNGTLWLGLRAVMTLNPETHIYIVFN